MCIVKNIKLYAFNNYGRMYSPPRMENVSENDENVGFQVDMRSSVSFFA